MSLAMLRAVAAVEAMLARGVSVAHALDLAAGRHSVQPLDIARLVLAKMVGAQRARAAIAKMQEVDATVDSDPTAIKAGPSRPRVDRGRNRGPARA